MRFSNPFQSRIWLIIYLFTPHLLADVPKKIPLMEYAHLWNESPFTTKSATTGAEEVNPFEDLALFGVSPIAGGYRVTMVKKKSPDSRIVIESGVDNAEEYKIVSVAQQPGMPLRTSVTLSKGAKTGSITFDEKLLTLKSAAPVQTPAQAQKNINIPNKTNTGIQPATAKVEPQTNVAPPSDATGSVPKARPRPRVVLPE